MLSPTMLSLLSHLSLPFLFGIPYGSASVFAVAFALAVARQNRHFEGE
jgi:hypothetical protein